MEPNWSKAPTWAKYLTMDDMGIFIWWENKPIFDAIIGQWISEVLGEKAYAGRLNIPNASIKEKP